MPDTPAATPTPTPTERAPLPDGDRWVRVAAPVLQELSGDWSRPVQVRIAELRDGELDLIFRTHECAPTAQGDPR